MWRVGALGLACLLIAAGPWSWGAAQAQAPRTLVIAIGTDQTGLDPQTVINNESGDVMSTIYDSIVEKKKGTSIVVPGLAESWTASPDGRTFTFKLRRGVTFSDGTPMNAHTVADDVARAIDPNSPCYVYKLKVSTLDELTYGQAEHGTAPKVDVPDDYTIRFTFPTANAPFLANLTMIWSGITSPTAVKQNNCDARQHPAGTGPFKFVETVKDDHTTVDANPAYWNGAPKLGRIIFKVVPESTTRLLQLERNEVQILTDVPASDYARIRGNAALRLLTAPGLDSVGIVMSFDAGPFKDVRVRQALNYAVDKDAINRGLYGGAGTASQGSPPPALGYDKSIKPYPYDPAKAQALLREAGFPNGFSTEMLVYAAPRGYNPVGGAKLGEAVQSYLAKVGIQVKLTQYEWGAYLDKVRHTQWEGMSIYGNSGDSGDPSEFLDWLYQYNEGTGKASLGNVGRYHNPKYDALLEEGHRVTDPARRAAIYAQANRILHDDAPWIFINNLNQVKAIRSSVQGFQLATEPYYFYMQDVSLR
ncbi:MAG: ABC transporter substrate-binding protein [bacterium]